MELKEITFKGSSNGVSRPIDEENPNEDTLFHHEHGVPSLDKTDGRPGRWMEKVRLYHLFNLWQQEDWIKWMMSYLMHFSCHFDMLDVG